MNNHYGDGSGWVGSCVVGPFWVVLGRCRPQCGVQARRQVPLCKCRPAALAHASKFRHRTIHELQRLQQSSIIVMVQQLPGLFQQWPVQNARDSAL